MKAAGQGVLTPAQQGYIPWHHQWSLGRSLGFSLELLPNVRMNVRNSLGPFMRLCA